MTIQLCTLPATYLAYPIPNFDYMGSCVLAGGAIRDSIQGIEYADLDIFGPDRETLEQFAEVNLLPDGYKLVYTSKFAHTYVKEGSSKVQTVFGRSMKNVEADDCQHCPPYTIQNGVVKLFEEFPFTINQFAYDGQLIYTTPQALADTLLRLMRVNTLDKPDIFDTFERVTRYKKKGYKELDGVTEQILELIESLTPLEFDEYSLRPVGIRGELY